MEAIVQTRYGRVRGTTAANGVRAFLGISYAAPPVGANRLRPPQPVEPWTGIRDATVIGPEPPQPQFGMDDVSGLLFDPAVMGDDCLNLNIWTPDLGAVGLPVMVFSPGGAFRYNSGGSYDGSRFARDGVVLVSINWRTGADGFLYLGEGDDGANLGLLDQVAALAWVRENIAAFGGDPGRVTVFGESAGAMSDRRPAVDAPRRGPVPARGARERRGTPRHTGRRGRSHRGAAGRGARRPGHP